MGAIRLPSSEDCYENLISSNPQSTHATNWVPLDAKHYNTSQSLESDWKEHS